MASELGFVRTIADEDDVSVVSESTDSEEEVVTLKKKKAKQKAKQKGKNVNEEFNTHFEFLDQDDEFDSWTYDTAMKQAKKKVEYSTLDEKIAKLRRQRKVENKEGNEDGNDSKVLGSDGDDGIESEEEESSSDEEEIKADTIKVKEKKKKKKSLHEEEEEAEDEKIRYSEDISTYDENLTFQDMNLSRPLLKALSTMRFSQPTPIQAATVPVALLGKDVCACAATGTGKTAAFMLPVLERLLYKPKQAPVTRVLVVTPTRELAIQIHQMSRQLAQYTNVDISLSAGGLDLKAQEAALRLGPDVVVATPGRLIDHVRNSPSFNLQNIEVLILDEADRMLDEYFAEQMKEVIRMCSRTRQTMLFSATMTEEVTDLAAVSLKNPVRVFVNQNTDVAMNLRQEFVRIRPKGEGDREGIVAALVTRTFHDHCMVFIQTKVQAHRMHILLGLLGVKVAELHGNLSQLQRLEALRKFKEGEVDVLLATDLAARGLDIPKVKTVINFTMPNSHKHYIHRVGRTARAGKSGRSVTLVGEKERKILKDIVKKARTPVKSRIVPQEVISKYRRKIASLEKDLVAVIKMEKEEKEMRIAEKQMNRAENAIQKKGSSSQGEPERTWFQTPKERSQEKAALRLGDLSRLPSRKQSWKEKEKKTKLTSEDRVDYEIRKAQEYSTRAAKREKKPKRMRAFDHDDDMPKGQGPSQKKRKKLNNINKNKSSFDQELTNTSKKALKKLRAGPSYEERKQMGMMKTKKGGTFKSKSRYKRR